MIFLKQEPSFLNSYSRDIKHFLYQFLFFQSLIIIWPTIYYIYSIVFVYQAYVLIYESFKTPKTNKQHQWSIVILMMIQQIPCKQALACHVAVESILYFSYVIVLLHCINTVMTSVVCRPFRLINSFDCHDPLHILFVVKIIQSPLSAFLWCMQIHVQNGLR